jgi:hypothetical protein
LSKIMAARKTPQPRAREASSRRSRLLNDEPSQLRCVRGGTKWQDIADAHWGGDLGLANRQVKQFWADLPKETVEEVRAMMLAKLDGVGAGTCGRSWRAGTTSSLRAMSSGCTARAAPAALGAGCPVLEDGKPIYDGVNAVRQLVETQLKLIPGLAAPKRVEMLDDDAIRAEIDKAPSRARGRGRAARRQPYRWPHSGCRCCWSCSRRGRERLSCAGRPT